VGQSGVGAVPASGLMRNGLVFAPANRNHNPQSATRNHAYGPPSFLLLMPPAANGLCSALHTAVRSS
jgi:hypothetical protein